MSNTDVAACLQNRNKNMNNRYEYEGFKTSLIDLLINNLIFNLQVRACSLDLLFLNPLHVSLNQALGRYILNFE